MNPRFKSGNDVLYSPIGYGIVERVVNGNDSEDIAAQGYRYEVRFRGELWSIPEGALKRRRPNGL